MGSGKTIVFLVCQKFPSHPSHFSLIFHNLVQVPVLVGLLAFPSPANTGNCWKLFPKLPWSHVCSYTSGSYRDPHSGKRFLWIPRSKCSRDPQECLLLWNIAGGARGLKGQLTGSFISALSFDTQDGVSWTRSGDLCLCVEHHMKPPLQLHFARVPTSRPAVSPEFPGGLCLIFFLRLL